MKTVLWIAAIFSIITLIPPTPAVGQPTLNREVTGKIGILNPKTTVTERNAATETLKFEPRRMTYPQSTVEGPLMGGNDSELEWLDASMRTFCDNEFAVYDDVNLTCAVPQDPQ